MLQTHTELSPAQKAWETRRRIAAARETIAAAKQPVAAPAPFAVADMVELYADDAQLGCGRRPFLVLEVGSKWVRLLSCPRLIAIKVARAEFDRHARRHDFKPRQLAQRIRATMAERKRLYPDTCARALANGKAALAILKNGRA